MVESTQAEATAQVEAYSIGKYVQNHDDATWENTDTHEEVKSTWLGHEMAGQNDWSHKYARLTAPGGSITA